MGLSARFELRMPKQSSAIEPNFSHVKASDGIQPELLRGHLTGHTAWPDSNASGVEIEHPSPLFYLLSLSIRVDILCVESRLYANRMNSVSRQLHLTGRVR